MSTASASATTAAKTAPPASAPSSGKSKGTAVDLTTIPETLRPAQQLEVKSIVIVDNPGRMEGDRNIDGLKHAIEQAGQVVNPITVRPTTEEDGELHGDGKYAVVDGRRRFRCAKSLGFKTVPVVLWVPGKGKERITTTQGAVLANLANRSLSAPEMLSAFLALGQDMDWDIKVPKAGDKGIAACGKDIGKLAKFTNTSAATIYRTLRMGLLDPEILKKVHTKVVNADAARDMGGLVAGGILTEDQAKLVFEEALVLNSVRAKVDNKRDPNSPDTRSPEVIKREKEAFKREKEKRRLAKEAAAAAAKAGETVADDHDDDDQVSTPVSKKDMKAAAASLAAEGKLSPKQAEAVSVASGKGAGISADAKRDAKIIAYLGETMDDLLNNANRHIALLAAAVGKFMEGELTKPELIKQFEKHCAGADD